MKMNFDYYTFNIGSPFLSAIINGDHSGLSDQEETDLNCFMDNLPVKNGHFDLMEDEGNFSRCEVSGLYSDCVETRLYFPVAETVSSV
jgi:hypothetical protein